jgi:hypothetical protein
MLHPVLVYPEKKLSERNALAYFFTRSVTKKTKFYNIEARRTRTGNELTDQIFEGPLKHVSAEGANFKRSRAGVAL